jgi:hypothetical protein
MKPEDLSRSGSEFGEQSALFCWANSRETRERFPNFYNPETRRCKMYTNYNNAGVDGDKKSAAIRGARAKQAGMQSGVADIFVPIARHGCHGLYVELKIDPTHPENQRTGKGGQPIAPKRGTVSDDQASFGRQVKADGYGWAVAEGWRRAAAIISQYLSD